MNSSVVGRVMTALVLLVGGLLVASSSGNQAAMSWFPWVMGTAVAALVGFCGVTVGVVLNRVAAPSRARRKRARTGTSTGEDVLDLMVERFAGSSVGLSWRMRADLLDRLVEPGAPVVDPAGRLVPCTATAYRWIAAGEDPHLLARAVAAGFSDNELSGFLVGGTPERETFRWLVALAFAGT